jgi:cyclic pyranopterin phosphate synthase
VRLTAEGLLLLCLGQEHSMDLKQVIRSHPGDTEALKNAIVAALDIKPKGHDFNIKSNEILLRHMNMTGG